MSLISSVVWLTSCRCDIIRCQFLGIMGALNSISMQKLQQFIKGKLNSSEQGQFWHEVYGPACLNYFIRFHKYPNWTRQTQMWYLQRHQMASNVTKVAHFAYCRTVTIMQIRAPKQMIVGILSSGRDQLPPQDPLQRCVIFQRIKALYTVYDGTLTFFILPLRVPVKTTVCPR